MAMTTDSLVELPVLRELRELWPKYLLHHRRPWTRRLHHAGSWACIVGAVLAIAWQVWWLLPAGIAVGYAFAFAGHWVVERNRPLTLGRPIFAGICNWIMFALEITGRLEQHMQAAEEQARDDCDDFWEDCGSA
jgi:hypothetical protein